MSLIWRCFLPRTMRALSRDVFSRWTADGPRPNTPARSGEYKMSESRPKPIPVADDLTRPFWDAARERRLVVQRCEACGYYNHPPRVACDACLSLKLRFEPVSGRGAVHTFTVMHQRNVPGFED